MWLNRVKRHGFLSIPPKKSGGLVAVNHNAEFLVTEVVFIQLPVYKVRAGFDSRAALKIGQSDNNLGRVFRAGDQGTGGEYVSY